MIKTVSNKVAATGETLVQFGLNVFVQPKGFTFGKALNIAEWRNQMRERRAKLLESDVTLDTLSQELNPQNQKQQLIAMVEGAKRPEVAQLANGFFPMRPVKLEHLFDPADRKGSVRPLKPSTPQISVHDLRDQLKATILNSEGEQLKRFTMIVNSVVRHPTQKSVQCDNAAPRAMR